MHVKEQGEPFKGSPSLFIKVLYLLWAFFLGYLFFSGRLSYFIAPNYRWLTLLSTALFAFMAMFGTKTHKRGDYWKMSVLVVPVALGVIVLPKGFGPKEALIKAVTLPVLKEEEKIKLLKEPLRELKEREYEDRDLWEIRIGMKYKRQEIADRYIKTIGFVHNSEVLSRGFYLLRFYITCCAADATPLAMIVLTPEKLYLKEGQWVEVRGKVKVVDEPQRGPFAVLLATKVKEIPIPPPEDQYMY